MKGHCGYAGERNLVQSSQLLGSFWHRNQALAELEWSLSDLEDQL